MMVDFFVKAALVLIGAMFSVVGGLLIWGIQKLASTLMSNTTQLITLSGKVEHVERYVERVQKLEKDMNNYYIRLEKVENQMGEP